MSLNKPPALGRGLDALFGHPEKIAPLTKNVEGELHYINIERIQGDIHQPRKIFKADEISELSQSIKEKGILQPIIVRLSGDNLYTIIAGERRWRAAKMAGLSLMPAFIKVWSEEEILEISLIENIQREDLTPLEEAAGYQRLITNHNYTQEQVSQIIKKSRSYIANCIRLLSLPQKIQDYVNEGKISASHARTLINHPDAEQLADDIIAQGLNVRHIEKVSQRKKLSSSKIPNDDLRQIQEQLENLLKLKVELSYDNGRGEVKINFKSIQQLDQLISKLNK